MPLTFPSSPTNGQTYVVGSRTWTWNGSIWEFNNSAIGVSSVGESEIINGSVTQAKLASTVSGITICTSSTRPGSPFEGQMIYETNTDILAIWNGTAWRQLAAATKTGSVLQVVTGTATAQASSNSTTHANTNLSAVITPSSASSKILVTVTQNGVAKIMNTSVDLNLVRDSTIISAFARSVGYTGTTTWGYAGTVGVTYLDSPATTSATTYKTTFASSSGIDTAYVNAFGSISYITLQEIAG
jgi:hypothetical protein